MKPLLLAISSLLFITVSAQNSKRTAYSTKDLPYETSSIGIGLGADYGI